MPGVNLGQHLPQDWRDALLVGRLDAGAGRSLSSSQTVVSATCRAARRTVELLNGWSGAVPRARISVPWTSCRSRRLRGDPALRLLAPCDLQCIKACGVTFAVSAVERVIEERARGDFMQAQSIRDALGEKVGGHIGTSGIGDGRTPQGSADRRWPVVAVPRSRDRARREVFTKSPVLSAVGWGDWIGVRSESQWNNPEPEIVLACDARGRILGAALGNDVNLRDIEGRSALLLGKAKDNNASCAIGPFIRLFDDRFRLDDVRSTVVALQVQVPTTTGSRAAVRCRSSAATRQISFDRPWTSTTIRTASCCSSEPCSRRRRTAKLPAAVSLTSPATSCASRRRPWGRW